MEDRTKRLLMSLFYRAAVKGEGEDRIILWKNFLVSLAFMVTQQGIDNTCLLYQKLALRSMKHPSMFLPQIYGTPFPRAVI